MKIGMRFGGMLTLVAVGLFVGALLGSATYVEAVPPGLDACEVGKLLYNFTVHAVPQDNWSADDTVCTNSGHRIFFERPDSGTGALGTILWTLDPAASNFQITDCDGTADGTAAVLADESVDFIVAIRILGAKTDSLNFVCTVVLNPTTPPGEDLCIIDSGTFNKGKDFTKVMANVADDEFEQVLWTLSTTTGFRIMNVRVYEWVRNCE